MSEDKSNPGHMLPMASHMDPFPTPLLDAMRQPAREHAVNKPDVAGAMKTSELVTQITAQVTAEILRKIKVTGNGPISVVPGAGGFTIGFNAPVVLQPSVQPPRPVFPEPVFPVKITTLYTLLDSGNTEHTDQWTIEDGVTTESGPDDSYDGVRWTGPRVVIEGAAEAYNVEIDDVLYDVTNGTLGSPGMRAGVGTIRIFSRSVTYNSKGELTEIGQEFLALDQDIVLPMP